jgi:integrase/recombinase XerD
LGGKTQAFNQTGTRHTAASDLVRAGVHPMQIQKLLGHSSLEIIQIYTHILPEDLRDAAEKLTCLG